MTSSSQWLKYVNISWIFQIRIEKIQQCITSKKPKCLGIFSQISPTMPSKVWMIFQQAKIHHKTVVAPFFSVDRKRRRNAPISRAPWSVWKKRRDSKLWNKNEEKNVFLLASFFLAFRGGFDEMIKFILGIHDYVSYWSILNLWQSTVSQIQGSESWIWTTTPIFQRRSSSRCARKNHDAKSAFFRDVV